MKSRLSIVKIGGKIIEDQPALRTLLKNFAAKDGFKILVHGGGTTATNLSKRLGIEPKMVAGRRITTEEDLSVVAMVYAGLINKKLGAILQYFGCNAIGLAGGDANAITSQKREPYPVDYGHVGDIVKVNDSLIQLMLENSLIPVFSAIGHDGKGQLLNTNADTVAAEIAVAMSNAYVVELTYCFEKKGVLNDRADDQSVITDLNEEQYLKLKEAGIIQEGMLPKLNNCFYALRKGVDSVKVGNSQLIEDEDAIHTNLRL